ncbi:Protein kinase domain [Carpediemonas membranifera]|uniref:Protein kinase domain n=1 Tax=Carpediemonas membranifera TaxID=201153 RepID=A0A8J6BBD8_9EUKA|nr:Protein kinase domain [Carpediemonas membranifera]|eukprot:KAG9393837.1 Protein kinase domain [Carpediemonas membranifera]
MDSTELTEDLTTEVLLMHTRMLVDSIDSLYDGTRILLQQAQTLIAAQSPKTPTIMVATDHPASQHTLLDIPSRLLWPILVQTGADPLLRSRAAAPLFLSQLMLDETLKSDRMSLLPQTPAYRLLEGRLYQSSESAGMTLNPRQRAQRFIRLRTPYTYRIYVDEHCHVFAVTSSGLFAWGANKCGELGVGGQPGFRRRPVHAASLSKDRPFATVFAAARSAELPRMIRGIWTSSVTTFVLTPAGLYSCGLNTHGALGVAGGEMTSSFHRVEFPTRIPAAEISRVTATPHRSAIFTKTRTFVCGLNKSGELGLGHTSIAVTPAPLPTVDLTHGGAESGVVATRVDWLTPAHDFALIHAGTVCVAGCLRQDSGTKKESLLWYYLRGETLPVTRLPFPWPVIRFGASSFELPSVVSAGNAFDDVYFAQSAVDGSWHAMGLNSSGRLGVGSKAPEIIEWTRVLTPPGKQIQSIFVSNRTSAFVTTDGIIFASGYVPGFDSACHVPVEVEELPVHLATVEQWECDPALTRVEKPARLDVVVRGAGRFFHRWGIW